MFAADQPAGDQAIWREYGLVATQTAPLGKLTLTSYQMKDTTGAFAAWEWLRTPNAHSCNLAALCSQDTTRTVVSDFNWVLVFSGGQPDKAQVASTVAGLPNKRESAHSALLTY